MPLETFWIYEDAQTEHCLGNPLPLSVPVANRRDAFRRKYVRVAYNWVNPGWGYMHEKCEILRKELWSTDLKTGHQMRRKGVHIFYLGDDNKYGHYMEGQINEQLAHLAF